MRLINCTLRANDNPVERFKRGLLISRLSILILALSFASCQKERPLRIEDLYAEQTTRLARQNFKNDLIANTIEKNLAVALSAETEGDWQDAFWGMALTGYHSDRTRSAIAAALDRAEDRSISFQRALLELVATIYRGEFIGEIKKILQHTANPKIFAMAANLILSGDETERQSLRSSLRKKFENWPDQPILFMLDYQLSMTGSDAVRSRPPLRDLLRHPFEKGKLVLYSFQRPNRDYPGLLLFRLADGNFLRDGNGNLFYVRQLARSLSNLPGYLTDGNSPRGIYSLQDTARSSSLFIGSTPNLQLVLPFEVSPGLYFHNGNMADTLWTAERYRNLLPVSWQNYLPIWETYYAGQAGRTEIIAHGTAIDINFYKGRPYYPFTPSLGCLTTREIWSENTGRCLYSDQLALANAYLASPVRQGYLILVEVDDLNQPVQLAEILADMDRQKE